MNVHVFTNTSVLDLNTLRTRASLLVGDATFVDGWRAVPLPPTDSLPGHPPDTTALDDFVHYVHDLDNSSFQSLPSPGQPRTRSNPSHSPATFLSQRRSASYGQQRVSQPTLFDESVSRTRHSDAPGSLSIYGMCGQLSILPSHPFSSLQDHSPDTSARNVLSPSIPSRISFNTVRSIPVPPNQLELYSHQRSLRSMQSANQDSLYGSHELRDNGQSTSRPSGSQQSSLDSLYTPARVTASHPQLVPTPFSPAEAAQRPSISQHAARGNEESYDFSSMIPPNQAQLNVNRFSNHQADTDTPQLQQHTTASSGNSRPLAPSWSQGSLYGALPAPGSQPRSNTTPPGLIHSSSCLPRALTLPQADASPSQSRILQGQVEDGILPGFVFTTPVGNTNASDANGTNFFGRYELAPHVPASQEQNQEDAGDDPPGLFHLSRSSDASHNALNRNRPQDDEDVAMDLEQNDEEQIPGLGSSWASLTQNEYLASRWDFEGGDGPDIDHVFTFDAHDTHSGMGGNSMDIDIFATGHTEEDAFAVEKDLTDTLGMQFSASVGPPEAESSGYDALPATQPASQSSTPPDPLSGPSVYWDSILKEQPLGSTVSHHPSQQSSQPVQTSQNHVQDLSQQQRVHEYTNDTPRASPAPSAYLSSEQALARQQARDQWGDKYDRALTAAYHQRHSREDPYAVEYGQPDLSGPPVSQDSRAADFPDDDSHAATPRPSQSRLPVEPTSPSPQVSSGPNPHSPYIPDRSLSQSDVQHQQPLTALAEHLRRAGANANTQFRSHLPVLPGKGASLPFTGRTHPRRPSDTVVPDSQEQRDKRERAKRKRVVWPDPLEWVFPEPHMYPIPTRRYEPPEPTPPESYRPSQDSIYKSEEHPSGSEGKGKEKAHDPPPPPDPLATPDPFLYPLPESDSSQSSQKPVAKQTRKSHASDPQVRLLDPFTVPVMESFLSSPLNRCAWVLPVRGTPGARFGWGATGASVLFPVPSRIFTSTDASAPAPASAQPSIATAPSPELVAKWWPYLLPCSPLTTSSLQDTPGAITWTAGALRALWAFLLQVRAAARVGLVSLSYTPAAPPISESERGWGREKALEADPLGEVDYITIYVASQYAMHVRQLLHCWRYEFPLPPEVVEVRRQRAREARDRKQAEKGERRVEDGRVYEGSASVQLEGKKDDGKQTKRGEAEREDIASFRMFHGARLVLLDGKRAALTT